MQHPNPGLRSLDLDSRPISNPISHYTCPHSTTASAIRIGNHNCKPDLRPTGDLLDPMGVGLARIWCWQCRWRIEVHVQISMQISNPISNLESFLEPQRDLTYAASWQESCWRAHPAGASGLCTEGGPYQLRAQANSGQSAWLAHPETRA